MRARLLAVAALTVAALVALAPAPAASAQTGDGTRDVLVVSNNWAGTADLIDPRTFRRLKRIDVIPDREQRVAEIRMDPTATFYFDSIRELVGEGHDQYVDDGFTSPDGRVVYFSRPSFADVVAIDLRTGAIRWRAKVDGYRADHMAISESGRRLLVSASTANVIDVIDTRTGRIVQRIPSATPRTRTTSRATARSSSTRASGSSTRTPTRPSRTRPRACASSRSSTRARARSASASTWVVSSPRPATRG